MFASLREIPWTDTQLAAKWTPKNYLMYHSRVRALDGVQYHDLAHLIERRSERELQVIAETVVLNHEVGCVSRRKRGNGGKEADRLEAGEVKKALTLMQVLVKHDLGFYFFAEADFYDFAHGFHPHILAPPGPAGGGPRSRGALLCRPCARLGEGRVVH